MWGQYSEVHVGKGGPHWGVLMQLGKYVHSSNDNCVSSKEFKRGNRVSFLTDVLMLWGGSHITRHVWRWVIVLSDLAQCTICAHYHYRGIHCAIINMHAWFESMRERANSCLTKLFDGLGYKKILRYNNSPQYVMAKWPPQKIPLLISLVSSHQSCWTWQSDDWHWAVSHSTS